MTLSSNLTKSVFETIMTAPIIMIFMTVFGYLGSEASGKVAAVINPSIQALKILLPTSLGVTIICVSVIISITLLLSCCLSDSGEIL